MSSVKLSYEDLVRQNAEIRETAEELAREHALAEAERSELRAEVTKLMEQELQQEEINAHQAQELASMSARFQEAVLARDAQSHLLTASETITEEMRRFCASLSDELSQVTIKYREAIGIAEAQARELERSKERNSALTNNYEKAVTQAELLASLIETRTSQFASEKEALSSAIEERDTECERLANALADQASTRESEVSTLLGSVSELTSRVQDLEDSHEITVAQLKEEISAFQDREIDYLQTISELTQQVQDSRIEFIQLRDARSVELEEASAEISRLQNELAELQLSSGTEIQQHSLEVLRLENEVKTLKETSQREMDSKLAIIDQLQESAADFQQQVVTLISEKAQIQSAAETHLMELQESHSAQLIELQESHSVQLAQCREQHALTLRDVEDRVDDLCRINDELTQRISSQQEQIASFNAKLDEQGHLAASLQKKYDEDMALYEEEAAHQLEMYQTSSDGLKAANESLQQRLDALLEGIRLKEEEVHLLTSQLDAANAQLQEIQHEKSRRKRTSSRDESSPPSQRTATLAEVNTNVVTGTKETLKRARTTRSSSSRPRTRRRTRSTSQQNPVIVHDSDSEGDSDVEVVAVSQPSRRRTRSTSTVPKRRYALRSRG